MAGLSRVILCLIASVLGPASASNVGCLFSESVCQPEVEYCFDDGAFGRCIEVYGNDEKEEEEPYRFSLEGEELAEIEGEMSRLLGQGYNWPHPHTQCVIQALLFAIQTRTEFDKILCDQLSEENVEDPEITEDNDQLGEEDMASIRYVPSETEMNSEFADEVYTPPRAPPELPSSPNIEFDEEEGRRLLQMVRRSAAPLFFSRFYNTPDTFRGGLELRDLPEEAEELMEQPEEDEEQGLMRRSAPLLPYLPVRRSAPSTVEDDDDDEEDDTLLLGEPELDTDINPPPFYPPPAPLPPANHFAQPGEDEEDDEAEGPSRSATGFSEGGSVALLSKQFDPDEDEGGRSGLAELLDQLGEWSFRRSERLDVKKPGPQFSTNNYAFQETTKPKNNEKSPTTANSIQREGQKETIPNDLPNHPIRDKLDHKKGLSPSVAASPEDKGRYDIVDMTYTYIEFKTGITTWKQGVDIIKAVSKLLDAPEGMFQNERVDRNEVAFKVVEPNPLNLSASGVANKIDEIKNELKAKFGVEVTGVGVGNKTKMSVRRVDEGREHEVYVVLVMVCGVLAALVLSSGVLYLTRRHGNKLSSLTSDTDPTKHYQDLCRARMSSKGESVAPAQRVSSLSRESDNSPSSRSSTSSWSEEPALSNMDVSTGQMVLSYMEDHLKNKERLNTEWAALCAYQPDPSSIAIAQKDENKAKNRCPEAVPFDHARVVLSELSNITGSDYINASTISDHDPRNAAYIVSQGPLPTTAPDFWQMVWEQGCVVIVMLTRLVENDNAMCHRYWPEEGSELYHIFEVHLVSEHIWCDDYLVRSFYLKNLKTGETRTVTQFHFLSWPHAGVPASTKPLLEFRRKVNKSFRGRSCPIVVHCSDGVGRSGSYCLLDMVLNRMAKGAKEIDVAATLEHIRDQRPGALATQQQFQFVLTAVADEVQAILRVHPANQ